MAASDAFVIPVEMLVMDNIRQVLHTVASLPAESTVYLVCERLHVIKPGPLREACERANAVVVDVAYEPGVWRSTDEAVAHGFRIAAANGYSRIRAIRAGDAYQPEAVEE